MARRTFLIVAAGASTALVAACSSAGSTASVSADDQVRAQVADAERALIAQYDQAIAAFPELGPSLGALVEQHRAHLASMGGALASAPADQVASSPPAAVAPATPSQALAALADEWAESQGDVSAFVAELDRRAQSGHAPEANAVTLASLHAAKGLEWRVVFLVGCSEGLLPIHYAQTDAQLDEERRLAYVGMTRAREELHLSWARSRQPGGRPSRRMSRFLDSPKGPAGSSQGRSRGFVRVPELTRDAGSGSGAERIRRGPKGPAKCRICGKGLVTAPERTLRRCRTCPSNVDVDVIERIKEWRLARARDLGVPAYVICTDATVLAIAEMLPATPEELLEIPGIGPAKLEQHGADLLALVRVREAGSATEVP